MKMVNLSLETEVKTVVWGGKAGRRKKSEEVFDTFILRCRWWLKVSAFFLYVSVLTYIKFIQLSI